MAHNYKLAPDCNTTRINMNNKLRPCNPLDFKESIVHNNNDNNKQMYLTSPMTHTELKNKL